MAKKDRVVEVDTPQMWRDDPVRAFALFVASTAFLEMSLRKPSLVDAEGNLKKRMPVRKSTETVYTLMWGRYLAWLQSKKLSLHEVHHGHLRQFLEATDSDGKPVLKSATIRRQYLTLFERVYKRLGFEANPAAHVTLENYRHRTTAQVGKNADKVVLTLEQQQAFLDALPGATPDTGTPASWKIRRDRAMMAMMLGAGLKVSEVIGLYIENVGQIEPDGSLPVTISPGAAGGTVRWHETVLRPFAAPFVLQWIEERKALDIPGRLLFPASREGRRMIKQTVYKHVKATFAEAGIDVPRQGGRTLRNAYAVRELLQGQTEEAVGELLGHRTRRSIEPYVEAMHRGMEKPAKP